MLLVTKLRNEKGISQAKLSRMANICASSLCRIEKGKEPAYPNRGQRIADALGWEDDYKKLFEEVSEDE